MNLVYSWMAQFLSKLYQFKLKSYTGFHGDYLGATIKIDLSKYLPTERPHLTMPVTCKTVNDFCGRESYFRKCLKEAHDVNIRLIANAYAFDNERDFAIFVAVIYTFFLTRDNDGFIYHTPKGDVPYDNDSQ